MGDIVAVLTEHEFQEWRPSDAYLYGTAPSVCSCKATPGLPPEDGDWNWWVRHIKEVLDGA